MQNRFLVAFLAIAKNATAVCHTQEARGFSFAQETGFAGLTKPNPLVISGGAGNDTALCDLKTARLNAIFVS